MGAAGDRVFGDAAGWCEIPGDEIVATWGSAAAAVTMIPRMPFRWMTSARAVKSGFSERTATSSARVTSRSRGRRCGGWPRPGAEGLGDAVGGRRLGRGRGGEVQADAAVEAGPGDQGAEVAGEADCQRHRVLSVHRAVGVQGVGGGQRGVTAQVALGGRGEQRSAQSASSSSGRGRAKAVSCLSSAATCRIHALSGQGPASSRQTPAGLPANGRSANASMNLIRTGAL